MEKLTTSQRINDEHLDIKQASELINIKVSTLYSWVHARRINFRKHGGKLVFSKLYLLEWSAQREVKAVC